VEDRSDNKTDVIAAAAAAAVVVVVVVEAIATLMSHRCCCCCYRCYHHVPVFLRWARIVTARSNENLFFVLPVRYAIIPASRGKSISRNNSRGWTG